MNTKNKWPEITALIDNYLKEKNKEKGKTAIRQALILISQHPQSHDHFREYLTSNDVVTKEQFDKFMEKEDPDFQPLYNSHLQRINPALNFDRHHDMALVTSEIVARIKLTYKDHQTFANTIVPAIITSRGTVHECSDAELSKLGLRARAIPSHALDRWHPEDIGKFIKATKNSTLPAPNLLDIFQSIRAAFTSYVHFENPVTYDFMSIHTIGTYFYPLFQAFPLLILYGPTESGKSLTMQIIEYLAFNAVMITDPTPAVIFRTIEELCPTMLMDEIEGLANRRDYSSSIMSILRASYKRIDVPRMEEKPKGVFKLRLFCCYGPKVIGTIQGVENVLANRSVTINLVRRRPEDDSKFERTDPGMKSEHWRQLRNHLYLLLMTRWQELNALIESTINELVGTLSNRQLELWTPFLSIANWIDRAQEDRGRTLFTSLLDMALQKSAERQMIDRQGNQTLMVLQALQRLIKETPKDDPWYSSYEIKEKLEEFYAEPQGWISEVWIGRLMNQIGIVKSRRKEYKTEFIGEKRLTHYWIDPAWLKDYCKRYAVETIDREDG